MGDGLVQLDRRVDSIHVGRRHRVDLGDLDGLVESIRTLGMLQPITISPEGTLICGARRLAAVQRLGRTTINVWVRSGISTRLQSLLAEQAENVVRKPFTPLEAAALYAELKDLLAEDADRRQRATRFGARGDELTGAADSARPGGPARAQAAQMVTGRKSHTRLERICELQALVEDPYTDPDLRRVAQQALTGIADDGKVDPRYRRVLATKADAAAATAPPPGETGGVRRPGGVRAFVLTWTHLQSWQRHYDPGRIGPALYDGQWTDLLDLLQSAVDFVDRAGSARSAAGMDDGGVGGTGERREQPHT